MRILNRYLLNVRDNILTYVNANEYIGSRAEESRKMYYYIYFTINRHELTYNRLSGLTCAFLNINSNTLVKDISDSHTKVFTIYRSLVGLHVAEFTRGVA